MRQSGLRARVAMLVLCASLVVAAGCGTKNKSKSSSVTAGTQSSTTLNTTATTQSVTNPTDMTQLDAAMTKLGTDLNNLDSSFSGSEGSVQ